MQNSPAIAVLIAVTGLICAAWSTNSGANQPMTEYAIGRDAIDATLPDGATLQIELWYPAQYPATNAKSGTPDFLFSPDLKRAMVEYIGMPKMAISTKEKGKGRRGVQPAEGPWPLIVFSHGFASFSRQNNRQAEALAQAGYVVAALSHPGESLTTEYADGRIEPIDSSHPALQYMGKRARKKELLAMAQTMNTYLAPLAAATSETDYLAAMQALTANTLFGSYQTSAELRRTQLTQWVKSLIAEKNNGEKSDSAILQQADLSRIALYGHSLGGVVSVAASEALHDQGIKVGAAISLDVPQFLLPHPGSLNLNTPACFLMGGSTKAGKVKLTGTYLNTLWANNNPQVCEINIEGAAHNNFTDLSWVTPLKWFGLLGSVPNKKFGKWLNGFLVAYFDHHLKNQAYNYPNWKGATISGTVTAQ